MLTLPNITVDPQNRTITIQDTVLNVATLRRIDEKITNFDGVRDVRLFFGTLRIGIVPGVSIELLAALIRATVQTELDPNAKPINVRFTFPSFKRSAYILVQTDYRHTDGRLLDLLNELPGIEQAAIDDNGYNIAFYFEPNSIGVRRLKQMFRERVEGFYNGTQSSGDFELLNFVIDDSKIRLTFNRRLPAIDSEINVALSELEGVGSYFFNDNQHTLVITPANSFFPKGKLALAAFVACEQLMGS